MTLSAGPLSSQLNLGIGSRPDVAYNASIDRYLAAWDNNWVAETILVRPNGTLGARGYLPGPNHVGFGYHNINYTGDPRVAAIQSGTAKFAVVSGGGLWVSYFPLLSAVDAQGRVTGTMAVDPNWPDLESIDVGGEATTLDDDVIVVFNDISVSGLIRLAECNPATLTTLQLIDLTTTPGLDRWVAIASTGGLPGRYLITWERQANGNPDIYGAIVDRDLNVLVRPFPIAQTTDFERFADVDGDGTNWIVAYERASSNISGDHDVLCRRVTYDARSGAAYVSGAVVVEGDVGDDETRPTVSWSGESVQIAFSDRGGVSGLYVTSLESFQCVPCEGESRVQASTGYSFPPSIRVYPNIRVASTGASGSQAQGGLRVWVGPNSEIFGETFAVHDGAVRDLGGGCGAGGEAGATCAAVGAPAFGLRVQHAAPAATSWLVLGVAPPVNFACGPCTLVPNPVAVLPALTDALGNAEVAFQLGNDPSQRGAMLQAQWLVIAPGGCSALGLSLSNAIEVTIE